MGRIRHTPEQIAAALRQAEAGTPIVEIIRKLGVHENTFYLWKKKLQRPRPPPTKNSGCIFQTRRTDCGTLVRDTE